MMGEQAITYGGEAIVKRVTVEVQARLAPGSTLP
jgi:hypothetical protein